MFKQIHDRFDFRGRVPYDELPRLFDWLRAHSDHHLFVEMNHTPFRDYVAVDVCTFDPDLATLFKLAWVGAQ